MSRLITIWFDLCLLRAGPQDLPASRVITGITLSCYVLVSFLIAILSASPGPAVQVAVLDAVLLVIFTTGVLSLLKKMERFDQTLSALAGSGTLLGLIAWPVVQSVIKSDQESQLSLLTALFWVFLLIWNLLVMAHIMRHAMSASLLAGMGVAILYAMISFSVISVIFPQQTG